jgi:pilus assembly protein Flp/PilA
MLFIITFVQSRLATLKNDERGATAVEYGLMVSLIAGVIIVAVTALGVKLDGVFNTVTGKIK